MSVSHLDAVVNIVLLSVILNAAASLSDHRFQRSLVDDQDHQVRRNKRDLPKLTTTSPTPVGADSKSETIPPVQQETTLRVPDEMVVPSTKDLTLSKKVLNDIHGSDEMKVFFRDCAPYMKDTLFGGPVCATDAVTYPNFMYMECTNYRKKPHNRVKVEYEGPCWSNPGPGLCSTEPFYDPVCGSDNKTYVNAKALECVSSKSNNKELTVKFVGPCMERSPCFFHNYSWHNPVCTTSARTLQSHQAVQCLRSLENDLEILHDGHCNAADITAAYGNRSSICRHLKKEVEPFPVCASDGQTYPSAAYVLCKKPHLKVVFNAACNSSVYESCKKINDLDKLNNCQPVCGSDGNTYNSKYHLNCATHDRRYLTKLHEGPCEAKDSPCTRLFQGTDYEPVCSTEGVTYISILALECIARYSKHYVQLKHMGPCLKSF